jgi:hypothetical protein
MDWTCSLDDINQETHKIIVGKPLAKQLFRGPRWRWEDNIKMNFIEVTNVDWAKLALDSVKQWAFVFVVTCFHVIIPESFSEIRLIHM